MKSLYESIMQSRGPSHKIGESILGKTGVGIRRKVQDIISHPAGKSEEMNEIWKKLGLQLSVGAEEGYWGGFTSTSLAYYVRKKKDRDHKIVAYIGKAYSAADIIFVYNEEGIPVREWAEKIAKSLDMKLEVTSGKNIYLNF